MHFSCCKFWVLGPPPLVSRSMLCLKVSFDFFPSNPFYHPTDTMAVVTYMTSQSMTVGHGIHPTSCRRKRTGLRRCAMRSGTWLCTLTCWKRKQDKVGTVLVLTLGNQNIYDTFSCGSSLRGSCWVIVNICFICE